VAGGHADGFGVVLPVPAGATEGVMGGAGERYFAAAAGAVRIPRG